MKRKLPAFETDEEASRFLDRKDLQTTSMSRIWCLLISSSSARQKASQCAFRPHCWRL